MELPHTSEACKPSFNLQPCVCALYLCCPLNCCLTIEVEPEQDVAPFVEDPEPEPRQQGKQPPIDHVDKNLVPSHSLMHD